MQTTTSSGQPLAGHITTSLQLHEPFTIDVATGRPRPDTRQINVRLARAPGNNERLAVLDAAHYAAGWLGPRYPVPAPLRYDPRVHALRLWLDGMLAAEETLSRRRVAGLDVELHRLRRMRQRIDADLMGVAWVSIAGALALAGAVALASVILPA